jgi:hypothetical protein
MRGGACEPKLNMYYGCLREPLPPKGVSMLRNGLIIWLKPILWFGIFYEWAKAAFLFNLMIHHLEWAKAAFLFIIVVRLIPII